MTQRKSICGEQESASFIRNDPKSMLPLSMTGIDRTDLLEAGRRMGIKERRCKEIASETGRAAGDFSVYAAEAGLSEKTFEFIGSAIELNRKIMMP